MHLHRFPTISCSVSVSACTKCITLSCCTSAIHAELRIFSRCREYAVSDSFDFTGRRTHGKCGVPTTDLLDELWQDRTRRRAIQLGQWTHAHDVPVGEDIIYSFHDVPYPPEMDNILAPHKFTIQYLISLPRLENIQHLPSWTSSTAAGKKSQAQVAHWIYDNFEEARETVVQWLGCAPFAHTLSIVLACNKRSILEADPSYPRDGTTDAQEEFILEAAWATLLEQTGRSTDVTHTDVDLECLSAFEQRLFEKSARSGSAGNFQWGLDAGNHQDSWDPYAGLPSHWNHEDCNEGDPDYDENELERGPDFSDSENVAASTNELLISSSQRAPGPRKRQQTKSHGEPRKRRKVTLTAP
ncbi:hypothetical protein EDB19DRAFT_2035386 [Suillus lakei]|nr:hypothetical protein EDB19DRAFT_2035386 [Suillus lakei]